MTFKADFVPSYDFNDENFVRLKENLLLELKNNFLQRLEKARDKTFVLENEKTNLAKLKSRTVEVYGSILLSEFETSFS